jgi:hypothetical protein
MHKIAGHIVIAVSVLCAACASSIDEIKNDEWLRASVLDLRYKSSSFDESRVLVVGYLPDGGTDNFLWLYATRESAKSRDTGFGISMIAATDELETIRNQCGSGQVHIVGYFVANTSPSGGIIAVEKITKLDEDAGAEGFPACWSVS